MNTATDRQQIIETLANLGFTAIDEFAIANVLTMTFAQGKLSVSIEVELSEDEEDEHAARQNS